MNVPGVPGGNLPSKTPVSVLQELLSRRGTTPKYELVQIEGAIHEPTFRYRVTVGEVIGKDKTIKHFSTPSILRLPDIQHAWQGVLFNLTLPTTIFMTRNNFPIFNGN